MNEDWVARLAAPKQETPTGDRHLHLLARGKGTLRWVVRSRRSLLCGTPRCRLVIITERQE